MADDKPDTLYRDNEIDGFRMGALFDLRVRFAFEMLQRADLSSLMWGLKPAEEGKTDTEIAEERGRMAARACLAATSELVGRAEKMGLVTPLPEGGVSTMMKRHAPRVIRWQVEQEVWKHRAQQEFPSLVGQPAPAQMAPILPATGGNGSDPTSQTN